MQCPATDTWKDADFEVERTKMFCSLYDLSQPMPSSEIPEEGVHCIDMSTLSVTASSSEQFFAELLQQLTEVVLDSSRYVCVLCSCFICVKHPYSIGQEQGATERAACGYPLIRITADVRRRSRVCGNGARMLCMPLLSWSNLSGRRSDVWWHSFTD